MRRENLVSICSLHCPNIPPTSSTASVSLLLQAATDAGSYHGENSAFATGAGNWLAKAAIPGDLLSAVISIRYILGFRKDNPNVFNMVLGTEPLIGRNFARHFHITLDHGRQVIIRS